MDISDQELLDYSKEHLYYEVEMLLTVGGVLLTEFLGETSHVHKNALIESFVVHLRTVITFLYPTAIIKETDMYAKYFFSDPRAWEAIRPNPSRTLEAARQRAHKEVGHLTTERIAGAHDAEKEWPVRELLEEIKPILILFCTSADKNKLHGRVSQLLS